MREILFRGKRIYNSEWVQGNLVIDKNDKPHIVSKDYFCEDGHHLQYYDDTDKPVFIDPVTVGQYTGLTDKNGTKIFEGDIIKRLFYLERPVLSVVTFKNGAFGLEWNRGKVKEFSAFTSICNCTYEVIGNFYDDAELLGDI